MIITVGKGRFGSGINFEEGCDRVRLEITMQYYVYGSSMRTSLPADVSCKHIIAWTRLGPD